NVRQTFSGTPLVTRRRYCYTFFQQVTRAGRPRPVARHSWLPVARMVPPVVRPPSAGPRTSTFGGGGVQFWRPTPPDGPAAAAGARGRAGRASPGHRGGAGRAPGRRAAWAALPAPGAAASPGFTFFLVAPAPPAAVACPSGPDSSPAPERMPAMTARLS